MSSIYSKEQVISAVAQLDDGRLLSYIEAEIIRPVQTPDGPRFRKVDIVRMEVLCDLADRFELNDDALAMMMSLMDQLHGTRAELRTVLDALKTEPDDLRQRIEDKIRHQRSDA